MENRKKNSQVGARTIGIMGTGRSVGVTHLAMAAANYLTSVRQAKTAVIEWNGHGDFNRIGQICASSGVGQSFKALGVTCFPGGDAGTLAACMGKPFEEIIVDFGSAREGMWAEWMRCQVKILVVGLSEWQLENTFEILERGTPSKNGWIYLTAFGSENTRREIKRQLGISLRRIPFSTDAFLIDYPLMNWFKQILQ